MNTIEKTTKFKKSRAFSEHPVHVCLQIVKKIMCRSPIKFMSITDLIKSASYEIDDKAKY